MDKKTSAAMLAETFKKPNYEDIIAPQTSFRLNVLVTARLKALSEMYPDRSMNEIVNALLGAALGDFRGGLHGEYLGTETLVDGSEVERFEGCQDVRIFDELTEKHASETLEKINKKKR